MTVLSFSVVFIKKNEFIIEIYYRRFSTMLKETLPKLIPFQETAYVKNRFIGEGVSLISDILQMSESLNLKVYIVTVDIEKAFEPFFFICLSNKNMDIEMAL